MRRLAFAILLAAASGSAALAEAPNGAGAAGEPGRLADTGRFSMTPAEGGFLRLDKETGAVAFCAVRDGVASCRAGADERAALEAEIARLRTENIELKARAAAGAAPPSSTLPNEEQFEQALSFTERFMRRILRLFREEAPQGDRL